MRTDKIDTHDMISLAPGPSCGDVDIMIRRKIFESLGMPLSMIGAQVNYSSASLDLWMLRDWGTGLPTPKSNDSES